jgi:hypothetical protein
MVTRKATRKPAPERAQAVDSAEVPDGSGLRSSKVAKASVCRLCGSVDHDVSGCAKATTGARALIDAGAAQAGSQTALTKILGISIAGLSRCRKGDRLDADFREVLVSYLLDPAHPLPAIYRGWGRRSFPAAELGDPLLRVHADADVLEEFLRISDDHVRGRVGAMSDALNEFMVAHKTKVPRAPERLPLPKHMVRIDADIFARFEQHVGGAAYRNRYISLALTEYVNRRRPKAR